VRSAHQKPGRLRHQWLPKVRTQWIEIRVFICYTKEAHIKAHTHTHVKLKSKNTQHANRKNSTSKWFPCIILYLSNRHIQSLNSMLPFSSLYHRVHN